MIDPFSSGAVAFHILLAGALTFVLGVLLLVLYRRAVQRWMRASSTHDRVAAADIAPAAPPPGQLAIDLIDPAEVLRDSLPHSPRHSPAMRAARTAFRRAAIVYALAGVTYALTATALQIAFGMFAFAPVRAAVVLCANAWPVVLTLVLFWGPDRRRQAMTVLAYVAVVAMFGLIVELGPTPPLAMATLPAIADPLPGTEAIAAVLRPFTVPAFVQPLVVWVLFALPTVYLLLVLNRRVRAIGPVLLTSMLIAVAGVHLATLFLGSKAGFAAFGVAYDIAGVGASTWFYGLQLAALILFMVPGWVVIAWLARRYDRKVTSDQTLVFDAIWLFATLLLCQGLIGEVGLVGWAGLLAFVAYKLTCWLGLAPLAAQARQRPPTQLLLLRVFGYQRRTEILFAVLCSRWRYAGSIQLIAAPDLATTTIEPGEFLQFLSGRLRRLFVHDRTDLNQRLTKLDVRPDPDARFRVNEFFCTDDTWREAATRLMQSSHVVVMDLRGFAPTNRGCIFELQALFDGIDLARLTLLVDRSTDLPFLNQTLTGCWQRLGARSPNRRAGCVRLRLLQTAGGSSLATRALIAHADTTLPTNEG